MIFVQSLLLKAINEHGFQFSVISLYRHSVEGGIKYRILGWIYVHPHHLVSQSDSKPFIQRSTCPNAEVVSRGKKSQDPSTRPG